MAEGRFDPSPIVTDRRPLAEFVPVMEALRAKPAEHLKALIDW
jgi:threonine dehydrogenase-like Zn-dependent dehydrogenase